MMKILHLSDLHVEPVGKLAYARANTARRMIELTEWLAQHKDEYDAIAFGCPSMGTEQLEESEFEPMFTGCETKLRGKRIALFGSYGWGDGEWMRNWENTCRVDGAILACDSVICQEAPDDDAVNACQELGAALV